MKELHYLVTPKTDALRMVEIFPQHQDTLEVFEILSTNIDNSLYED